MKGIGEEGTCHSNEPVTIGLLDRSAEDDEDDEILVCVIVERTLELGRHKRPKPSSPPIVTPRVPEDSLRVHLANSQPARGSIFGHRKS
jgi:hypothetical protein